MVRATFKAALWLGAWQGETGRLQMTSSGKDPDRQEQNARSATPATSDLGARIQRLQEDRAAAQNGPAGTRTGDMSGLARGLRIGAEFVAAILVGSGIGYLIDEVAGTGPWALLVMFMVGFAAGILNVTRVVAELNAQGAAQNSETDNPGPTTK